MSDQASLLAYVIKLEAAYLKLKQKMIREKNMFKGVLINLSQNLGVKCNETYFDTLNTAPEEDPLANWNTLFNKTDNVIRIRKDMMKKEALQQKEKRKRRTKVEMISQLQPQ